MAPSSRLSAPTDGCGLLRVSRASFEEFNSRRSGVHSQEPDCSGMEAGGIVKADGPVKPGQPSKPFAVVKPMRYVTPAFIPDLGDRDQGHREGRGTDLHRDPGLQGRPRRMLRPGLGVESDRRDEPRHHVESEATQTPSLPSTGAAMVRLTAQPGAGVQALPDASGYWVLTDAPTSGVYPCLGFRPLEGSTLFFTQTPSGTFVYGVPEFFTHIAQ
ncbi:proline-rich protein 20G [Panthera uncia]|uniref:proline-rich protein 20G n=1 Tax=Panthera uncia TaxID=29064 RepID=UPI0020FFB29D|nr:proline-rich protein 20G [Panthera uncia]